MNKMKKAYSFLAAMLSVVVILGSIWCNTVQGLGRDIERGGEKTQDAAESVKRRL